MRPVLIDTNVYVAFKRCEKSIVETIQQIQTIGISPIVLGELLSGFRLGKKGNQNRAELQQFLESPRVKIYPITSDTANTYSQIFFALKKKGTPIPTNDMWIAAQTLEQGCVLCSFDKHFEAVDGLVIGRTSAELVI